jgi:hypothetical protein
MNEEWTESVSHKLSYGMSDDIARNVERWRAYCSSLNASAEQIIRSVESRFQVFGKANKDNPAPAWNLIRLVHSYLDVSRPIRSLELSSFSWPCVTTSLVGGATSSLTWVCDEHGPIANVRSRLAESEWFFRIETKTDSIATQKFSFVLYCPQPGSSVAWSKQGERYGIKKLLDVAAAVEDDGVIFWIAPLRSLDDLDYVGQGGDSYALDFKQHGLYVDAIVEFAAHVYEKNWGYDSVCVVIRRRAPKQVFLAKNSDIVIDQISRYSRLWSAYREMEHPSGSIESRQWNQWKWTDSKTHEIYSTIENVAKLEKLAPKGVSVGPTILFKKIQRVTDRLTDPAPDVFFIPQSADGIVSDVISETKVGASLCWRVQIFFNYNREFLIKLLNSELGRVARRSASLTGQLESPKHLRRLTLPIPSIETQNRIAAVAADISFLKKEVNRLSRGSDKDWFSLEKIEQEVRESKLVFHTEARANHWYKELPFPVATVLRRALSIHATDYKDRFDALLHFYEVFSAFSATLILSVLREFSVDNQEALNSVLFPRGGSDIKRPDFGFWVGAINGGANRLRELGGSLTLADDKAIGKRNTIGVVIGLSSCFKVLDAARDIRNKWKGHGGYLGDSDAKVLAEDLTKQIVTLYELSADIYRRIRFVKIGVTSIRNGVTENRIEVFEGSDPIFREESIHYEDQLGRLDTGSLAFWVEESGMLVRCFPTVRISASTIPVERCAYVLNRYEKQSFRWVSYQEAKEQVITVDDPDLQSLVASKV